MKKFIVLIILFMFSHLLIAQSSLVQVSEGYNTPFVSTGVEHGVVLSPDHQQILLEAKVDTFVNELETPITLAANMWVYPNQLFASGDRPYLVFATDLDEINTGGSRLYLITDQNQGGKVILYNPNTEEAPQIWEDDSQRVPVDANFIPDDGGTKILVTYQSSNSVSVANIFSDEMVWDFSESISDYELDSPADAEYINNGTDKGYLIADQGNNRLLYVDDATKTVTWVCDTLTNALDGEKSLLDSPSDVEYVAETNEVLITDTDNHRIVLISFDSTKTINWAFGEYGIAAKDSSHLNKPIDADYLSDGRILIADEGNDRLLTVNRETGDFWAYHYPVNELQDVDQLADGSIMMIKKIEGDTDFAVNNGKHLPAIIDFQTDIVEANIFQVPDAKKVNFTNIFWQTDNLPEGTNVEMQFKSGNDPELLDSSWRGPDGTSTTWYTVDEDSLSAFHHGHRYYTFRILLETENKTETPIVSALNAAYEYYDSSDPVNKPNIFTPLLGDPALDAIVQWNTLKWVSIPPEDPTKVRYVLRINDTAGNPLAPPITVNEAEYEKNLAIMPELVGVNQIRITARPVTDDNSMTPILNYWEVTYNLYHRTKSELFFVDGDDDPVSGYVATTTLPPADPNEAVNEVRLWLNDDNAESQLNDITLQVTSKLSHDTELVDLSIVPPFKAFSTTRSLPIIIVNDTSMVIAQNDTFEVFDRDVLHTSYTDASDVSDVTTDSVAVILSTHGVIGIESAGNDPLTRANLGQQLFVRVSEENDKNIDLVRQDSLRVLLTNINTLDEEYIYLKEMPDANGIYNTANFFSPHGITLRNNPQSANNDGVLYARGGDVIQVIYEDNYTLRATVEVLQSTVVIQSDDPLLVEAAPNPFYASRFSGIRLRISTSSHIRLQQIEIFNLAGELINTLSHDQLAFYMTSEDATVEAGQPEIIPPTWWALTNSSGNDISSGTYWLRVTADVLDESDAIIQSVSDMEKVVIIR